MQIWSGKCEQNKFQIFNAKNKVEATFIYKFDEFKTVLQSIQVQKKKINRQKLTRVLESATEFF